MPTVRLERKLGKVPDSAMTQVKQAIIGPGTGIQDSGVDVCACCDECGNDPRAVREMPGPV